MAGVAASCSGDSAGPCTTDVDCGGGQRCDPRLGCVPAGEGDAVADPSACLELAERCSAGEVDACTTYQMLCGGSGEDCAALLAACRAGDGPSCEAVIEKDCAMSGDCDWLRVLCQEDNADACAALQGDECAVPDPCEADGACNPDCPQGEPDCPPAVCPDTCGPLPASAGEHCSWSCADGNRCVLVVQPGDLSATEDCATPAGEDPRDEDCDGLADCEDPDCSREDCEA